MEITQIVWTLFVILFPGVITTFIFRYITTNEKYTPFEFVIMSASFGVGVFVFMELFVSLYQIVICLFRWELPRWALNLKMWDTLFSKSTDINKIEIFISYIVTLPLGVLLAFLAKQNWLLLFFNKLGITNRYGDDDVWSKFLKESTWVMIRDNKTRLTYYGRVVYFSDTKSKREILVSDVSVYCSDDDTLLYEKQEVYLELAETEYSIETPKK